MNKLEKNPNKISEIEIKRYFDDFLVQLKNTNNKNGMVITLQIINQSDDQEINFSLKNNEFETFVELLANFSTAINALNPQFLKNKDYRRNYRIHNHETENEDDIGQFF